MCQLEYSLSVLVPEADLKEHHADRKALYDMPSNPSSNVPIGIPFACAPECQRLALPASHDASVLRTMHPVTRATHQQAPWVSSNIDFTLCLLVA